MILLKKIFFALTLILCLLLTSKAKAVELPTGEDLELNYQVYSETNEITFNFDSTGYEFKYDETKIQRVEEVKEKTTFVVLNSTSTRIFMYKNGIKVKVISLEFVNPTIVSVEKDSDGAYYVSNQGEKLYGDFTWLVDGEEVIASTVTGNDVSLKYNNVNISYIAEKSSLFNDYFVIIIGFPLFILIIGYVIVLILPINYYKRICKNATRLKNKLATYKGKKSKSFYLYIKVKVVSINNYVGMIPESCPKLKQLKSISTELTTTTDNLGKVLDYFPDNNTIDLINYYSYKCDKILEVLEHGNYKYKVKIDKKNLITIPKIVTPEMDKSQTDAYHYLEGIDVIRKDN